MSGLRAFATKLPGMSDQSRSQSAPNNDRVQAKMQELGFSGLVNPPQLRRQLIGDQQRVTVPRVKLQSPPSGSSYTHQRWQGYKTSSVSPETANDEVEFEQRSIKDASDHRDLFDTDIENLDSTVTLSDIDDAQVLQARTLSDKVINNSGVQAYLHGFSRGESFPFNAEDNQHQESDCSENNDLTMTEEDYVINDIENGSKDGDVLVRDALKVHELEFTQELNIVKSNHLNSYESPLIQEAKAESLASSTTHKNLVTRSANKPSPKLAIPFSTEPRLDLDHTTEAMLSVSGTQYHQLKSNPREFDGHGGSNGHSRPSERSKPNAAQAPIKHHPKRQEQRQMPAVAIGHSPRKVRSEPHRTTAQAITPTGLLVSTSTSKSKNNEYGYPSNGTKGLTPHEKESDAIGTPVHKRTIDLDYNPTELHQMTYQRLSDETFDNIPQTPMIKPGQGVAEMGLSETLQHVYELSGGAGLQWQRQTIFSELKIDQYEECGILLAEKISGIVTRYKVLRQQKRTVAMGFEAEVADRAERVLAKEQAINQDLGRLKKAGENVVRG